MLLLVSDANVLIDLEVGGVIEHVFRLGDTLAVPDVLFAEELEAQHARLITLGLKTMVLEGEALQRVTGWAQRHPKPSLYDWLAYALARQETAVLLTGDRDLRDAIKLLEVAPGAKAVAVHGTVWLLERMLGAEVLTPTEVRAAADLMRHGGRRLPWDAIDELLRPPVSRPRRGQK